MINLWDLQGSKLCGTLIGHSENICKLIAGGKSLTPFVFGSTSWDGSARCWAEDSSFITLRAEGAGSCWSLAALGKDSFVTGHADKSIKIWRGERQVQSIQLAHRDVVRDVLSLDDSLHFISAGNDGAIKLWDGASGTAVQVIEGAHSAFIYGLTWNGKNCVASFGEEGIVKLWKYEEQKLKEEAQLRVPMMSAWCACFINENLLVVGGSTGSFYIFSSESSGDSKVSKMFEAEMVAFDEAAHASKSAEISKNVQDEMVLRYPGERIGKTVLVKRPSGVIEAHQWNGGEWQNLGEVIDPLNSAAVKSPDFSFKVELDDTGRSFDLQYNWGENPYTVAKNFLERNDLPIAHLDEVANFIVKNAGTPPPANLEESAIPGDPGVLIVSAFNSDGVMGKLKSFGMTEVNFETISEAFKDWPTEKLFPCLDWLRVRVLQDQNAQSVLNLVPVDGILEKGTKMDSGKESVAGVTMLLRLICNCKNPDEMVIVKVVGKCCQSLSPERHTTWVPLLIGVLYNNNDGMEVTNSMALLHGLLIKKTANLSAEDVARIYWLVKGAESRTNGQIPLAAALKTEMQNSKDLESISPLLFK